MNWSKILPLSHEIDFSKATNKMIQAILIDRMTEECLFEMKMQKMLKLKESQFKIVDPESKL